LPYLFFFPLFLFFFPIKYFLFMSFLYPLSVRNFCVILTHSLYLLAVLESELRALHLSDKHSTTRATCPVLFTSVIFQIWSPAFVTRFPASDCGLPMASCVAEITIVYHHTWLVLLRWDLANLLSRLALDYYNPPDSHLWGSWDYINEPLPHNITFLTYYITTIDLNNIPNNTNY
jgi:hypothetical protein